MPRPRKQTLLMVLLLLLTGGAIINVAVAWGCALWGGFRGYSENTYTHESGARWNVALGQGFGLTRVVYVPDNGMWGKTGRETVGPSAAPYWSRTYIRPDAEIVADSAKPWSIEIGFGWPLRAGYAELRHYSSQHPGQSHPVGVFYALSGAEVQTSQGSSRVPYRVLPVQPIWPGFAINTIFYAAMLWVLWIAPGKIRRFIRVRRGRCPACAYPVGTSPVCTECGHPLAPGIPGTPGPSSS